MLGVKTSPRNHRSCMVLFGSVMKRILPTLEYLCTRVFFIILLTNATISIAVAPSVVSIASVGESPPITPRSSHSGGRRYSEII